MSERAVRVGITGGFGVGKSTVAAIFGSLGAKVVDADAVARRLLRPGTAEYAAVAREFGPGIVGEGGEIDRRALAEKVFGREGELEKLNRILHPRVLSIMERELASGPEVRVGEVPLLYEAGAQDLFDCVVAVTAPDAAAAERVGSSRGLSLREIEARRRNQLDPSAKAARARYVVDNGGTREETVRQVQAIFREITQGG
ncbi:MAG TPA: dephospho-CoA kinase [bacterium]|nr:dephospho-CoA kinase [bacterium]HPJ73179.1 dephospho-CoA kinase [bacterium]